MTSLEVVLSLDPTL